MKITCMTNVFNEEWLLPFWCEYHKKVFDHCIVVDYNSTDKSMEIVKDICPDWEIRTTRNSHFDAREIDAEFMDIERTLEGYKIVLNTTEFLISEKPLSEALSSRKDRCYEIANWAAFRKGEYQPSTIRELLTGFYLASGRHRFRSPRYIHNYPDGKYGVGRHQTSHRSMQLDGVWIVWCGMYPWCEQQIRRKLQIKDKMSQYDKDHGFGHQHTLPIEGIVAQRDDMEKQCENIRDGEPRLYAALHRVS